MCIAKIEERGFGISITTKLKKENRPWNLQIYLVSKEQRVKNLDIILVLDLLLKNNRLKSLSNTKEIC